MSEITSDAFKQEVFSLRHEPSRVGDYVADLLESALVDQNAFIMDPSQPLPFLIETSVMLSAAAVESYEIQLRQQYPQMAQTESDIYPHTSDVDMIGMFSTPGRCHFIMILSKSEVIQNAVTIDDSQSRKLTIPKHTEFKVNGMVFTMQYPIDIVIKPYGAIEITIDGTVSSPLQPLNGTRVEWDILRQKTSVQGALPDEYLRLRFPVNQMKLTPHVIKANPTSILKKTFPFTDDFYYARAFRQVGTSWVEIKTTHAEHTFDVNTPTLLLKVVDQNLTVSLPHVYQLTQIASATIRVDIYTTRGDVYMDLAGIAAGQFTARFIDLDNSDNNRYIAPMGALDTFTILSDDATSGGTSAPPFAVKRERILNNSIGPIVQPISPDQMQTTIEKLGFNVTLSVDDALGRTFKVSRILPDHVNGIVTTPIDSAVMSIRETMENLTKMVTVVDNISQVTILPSTLYKNVDGVLEFVTDSERTVLETSQNDSKVNMLASGKYLYTPLHYVMDPSNNQFTVRPYYLTRPTLDVVGYSASNDTIDVFVQASTSMQLTYTDTGYVFRILTESNAPYKALNNNQLHAQLAFKPAIEGEWVFTNGEILTSDVNGERLFEFRINTNWLIDSNHNLTVNNFTLRQNSPQVHETPLQGEWYIVWLVSGYSFPGMTGSPVDDNVGTHLLPTGVVGIHRETVKIRLGDEMSNLWRRSRPLTGSISYQLYEYDIPKTYMSNIYDRDDEGNLIFIEVDGKQQLKLLHAKGDVIVDPVTGEPEILHEKGTPVRNEYGELIPLGPRTVTWWWDVVLFDAQYKYTTRPLDQDYVVGIPRVLNEWINDTLRPLNEMLLDRTEFSFQPVNSLRYVNALVDDGQLVSIYTAQTLVVDLFLTEQAYSRPELQDEITRATLQVLEAEFKKVQISKESIISALTSSMQGDLVTAAIYGLGGGDYNVITLLDTTTRLCIAKMLNADSNGELSIVSNITINPKRHSTAK